MKKFLLFLGKNRDKAGNDYQKRKNHSYHLVAFNIKCMLLLSGNFFQIPGLHQGGYPVSFIRLLEVIPDSAFTSLHKTTSRLNN